MDNSLNPINEAEEFEFRARAEKERNMYAPEPKPAKPDLKGALDERMKEQEKVGAEARRGAALPFLGIAESIPYKPLQKYAAGKVKEIEQTPEYKPGMLSPRSVGRFAAETGLLLTPGGAGLDFLRAGTLGTRALKGAGAAAGVGALLQPSADEKKIGADKLDAALTGAEFGAAFSAAGPSIAKWAKVGYDKLENTINRTFLGSTQKAAEALREKAKTATGDEAQRLNDLANRFEQKATRQEKVVGKSEEKIKKAYERLPGTRVTKEAGRERVIPESTEQIGQNIRSYTDKIFKKLKDVRSANAEKYKKEAFDFASKKEASGQLPKDTKAFEETIKMLDKEISTNTLTDIRTPLQKIRNALDPVQVDPQTGYAFGKPASFESLENVRRFLRDRAFGLPAEGFDAIGQQQAGRLADAVEKIMSEFTTRPGEKTSLIRKFLDQYRKDSEPLTTFRSKIGKAITQEQIPGTTGFRATAATDIPNKVFANKENYQAFVKAIGNDEAFAQDQAQKFFVNQLESAGGDIKRIEDFIAKNRTMIKYTDSSKILDAYAKVVRKATEQGQNAELVAKAARDEAKKLINLKDAYDKIKSDIIVARDPVDIANQYEVFATKLLNNKQISQQQYQSMMGEVNKILTEQKLTTNSKNQLKQIAKYTAYWVGGGSAIYAGYLSAKYLFGE